MALSRPFLLLALAFGLAGCSNPAILNALAPSGSYSKAEDIAYGNETRQKLDIYLPAAPDPNHSVIVFFYGGNWQAGSKDQYLFLAETLAGQGYTVVIPDYRLYPDVYFPAFLDDGAKAIAWTEQHIADYQGNPQRIFVAGHSAGAYNAVMLSVNKSYLARQGGSIDQIRGMIGISGPYDFLPLTDPDLIDMFKTAPATETQPITFANHKTMPMLLVAGLSDTTVLPKNTVNMAAKLKSQGSDITEDYYPDTGHIGIMLGFAVGFRDNRPLLNDINNFIRAH